MFSPMVNYAQTITHLALQKGEAANGGATLAVEGLLGVFEDRGTRVKDDTVEVRLPLPCSAAIHASPAFA